MVTAGMVQRAQMMEPGELPIDRHRLVEPLLDGPSVPYPRMPPF
jgi:hypothetical protein